MVLLIIAVLRNKHYIKKGMELLVTMTHIRHTLLLNCKKQYLLYSPRISGCVQQPLFHLIFFVMFEANFMNKLKLQLCQLIDCIG